MNSRAIGAFAAMITTMSGLVVAASPSYAAPAPQLSVQTGNVTVHTANGMKWNFGVVTGQTDQGNDDVTLYLSRTAGGGTESHYWDVPVPKSTLTFNASTGHGAVRTPSSVAGLTVLNMKFTARSHHNASCSSGSETVYNGTLSGRATLMTHLKHGGTVGGQRLTFTSGTQLDVDRMCLHSIPENVRCSKSAFFDGSGAHHTGLFGFSEGGTSDLEVSHLVKLAKPSGAQRADYAAGRGSRSSTLNKTTKTLQVPASSAALVTGSGRVVATRLSQESTSCTLNGKHHTEVQYVGENSHFTNTSGHPVVGHTALTGKLTIASGASAYFDYETWH